VDPRAGLDAVVKKKVTVSAGNRTAVVQPVAYISLRYILILFSLPRLRPPCGVFPSGIPINILYEFPICTVHVARMSTSIKAPHLHFSPSSCFVCLLSSDHLHPVLRTDLYDVIFSEAIRHLFYRS